MLDDRPIKPDQKYLNDYLERINKIETKQYLKKRSQPFLPCQLHNIASKDENIVKKQHSSKSKAQLYEEIKKKNQQKFGDKKVEEPTIEQPKKKIDPNKITVDYKPKKIIQTEQYKKKDYTPKAKTVTNQPDKQKIQYEKLIDYFKQQLDGLEKEKQQFNKVAQKLKFKEMIRKEDGLLFTKIKSEVEKQLILSNFSISKENSSAQDNRLTHARSRDKEFEVIQQVPEKKNGDKLSKTFSAQQIRSCMEKTSEKLQQIKTQLLQRDLSVNEHRYDISQIHLLPCFDPQHLYDFLDPNKIRYNGNDHYRAALNAFNAKFKRERLNEENICGQGENEEEGNSDTRVKYVGEKRVMKYEGWTEVWIPGRQRLMANKEGYKVVWLKNGDVLQQFGNKIKSYYSLAKDLHKIEYKEEQPCYYHNGLGQIWRQNTEGEKEIVLKNGRRQIIEKKGALI